MARGSRKIYFTGNSELPVSLPNKFSNSAKGPPNMRYFTIDQSTSKMLPY